jgi:hypothetical protein
MFLTVAIATTVYLLPTIAAVSAEPDLSQWESGSFAAVANNLPHCTNGWLSLWISLGGAISSLSPLNAALSCNARELYASAGLGWYPFAHFLNILHPNLRCDLAPIRTIVLWAVLMLPFSLFDFSWLLEWSSLLVVLGQFVQIAVFLRCRLKCLIGQSGPKEEKEKGEDTAAPSEAAVVPFKDEELEVEDKFLVGGGWIGTALVVVPIFIVSTLLCVLEGWGVLLVSLALVAGMFILDGSDWGVRWLSAHFSATKDPGDSEGSPPGSVLDDPGES